MVGLDLACEKLPQLYDSASFDWGSASSEHQLAASWKLDPILSNRGIWLAWT